MTIYTITTFEKLTKIEEDSDGNIYVLPFPEFGNKRCAGFFTDINEALETIENDAERLHDYSYDFCIIEEYSDGIFIPTDNRYLFVWRDNKFVQIDEPIIMHTVTNFAMG